jgi:NADH-quinone oxidoreductase subunit N
MTAMNFVMPDLTPALPEIFVLCMACVVLLVDVLSSQRLWGYVLSLLTLLGAAVLTVVVAEAQTQFTFGGQFVADAMASLLKLMSYFAALAAIIYSRHYLPSRTLYRGEYFSLILFASLGMMVMISANHFLVLYIGLELLSLSLYALVALQRDSAQATEAAMKYFVLGALASGMLLYGMSLIYGFSGSLDLDAIRVAVEDENRDRVVLVFGMVFLVAGLGFKLGVAPFHMWVPDIYQGAPTAVTLFIGSAPKLAAFAFAMRLLVDGLHPAVADWQGMLAVMAALSLAIGNLAAIMQTNLKRMLAYSTISHMGFVLLGLLAGTFAGYTSAMYYAITYVLMSLGAFGILTYLSHEREVETLDDFKGLNSTHPWLAALMAMLMLSMAGIPPFVGFFAKLTVLQALIGAGWLWLAVLAIFFSLIGAYYYLRIVKLMYFDAADADKPIIYARSGEITGLLSANGLAVLLLGILPQPLLAVCIHSMQLSLQ